jgi:hypothetical protein
LPTASTDGLARRALLRRLVGSTLTDASKLAAAARKVYDCRAPFIVFLRFQLPDLLRRTKLLHRNIKSGSMTGLAGSPLGPGATRVNIV